MTIFFVNLKKQSFEFYEEYASLPDAWLLSSHRATSSTLEIARKCSANKFAMMADNGTIQYIREHAAAFAAQALPLRQQYRALRRNLPAGRRVPYTTEIPDDLRAKAKALFRDLCDAVDLKFAEIDDVDQVDIQLEMNPSHLIAKEDWSIAVLLDLGIERELLGFSSREYIQRNRQSIAGFKALESSVAQNVPHLFVTLAATDYTTALAAGKEAAKQGIENIALGFAGLNSDNSYTDSSYYPRRHRLKQAGPHRYVRLAEIMLGFRDAYRQSKTVLRKIHILGLGSRIMWAIPLASLDHWTDVSFDSTAPIKDAEGPAPIVYDPRSLDSRMAISAMADHFLQNGELPFDSPILTKGLETLPCDATKAKTILKDMNEPSLRHDLLRSGNILAEALPLFANGAGTALAGHFLANHNFWASMEACRLMPEKGRRDWAMNTLETIAIKDGGSVTVRNGIRAVLEVLGG